MKVRIDWNASPDVKAFMDKAVELEVEDDRNHDRSPRSRSSMLDTIMRRCLAQYLKDRGQNHA